MAIFMIAVISLDLYSILSNYKVKRSTIRADFIESKKLQLKEEVLNVVELIDYARNKNKVNVREQLKNKCENMYSIFNTLYEKHSTHHSEKELKEIYFNILKKFRFQDNIGYFFIIDNKGYGVFHPYLEDYPGTPIHDTMDSFGKKAFYEVMNKLSKKDGIFHDYYWNVEDQKHNRLKLAYFKEFKQFNWIMASTLYLDEVEKGLKERLLDQIGKIRFGKDKKDYLFVMSNEGVVQMNDVQRILIGKNILNMEDPNGVKVIQEEIKLAKNPDGGFLYYQWKKTDNDEIGDKLSFIYGIPEWNWFIGAGVYIDDVNLQIEKLYDELLENLKRKILYDAILFLIVFIVLYFVFEKNYKRFGIASDNIISELEDSVFSDKPLHIEENEFKELKSFKNGFNQILKSKQETRAELEAQRKRFEKIIKGTRTGTWAWNIQRDEVIFNERWANMLGYKLEELRPCNFNTFADLVHPDDIKIAEKRLNDHLEGKTEYYEIELRMRHKDGHWIWINDSGKVLEFDEQGRPLMAYGSHNDISERKQAEQKLKENEGKLSAIFSSMSEMVVLHNMEFDKQGKPVNYRIIDCNQAFTRITGIPREMAVNQLATELYGTDEPPYFKEYFEVALTGKAYHYETYFAPMDKYFSISVVKPGENQFATVTADITEHKKAEENLKKSQAYIKDIIDSMPSIIVGVDDDMNITQWNKKAIEYSGIDIEKAIGADLHDIDFFLKENIELIREGMDKKKIKNIVKKISEKKEGNLVFDITIYPLESNGNSGAVIRIDDITEQSRMQTIIMQTEKMMSVGGLAAGMAHEINNPLSGIIQSVQNSFRRIDPQKEKNIKISEEIGVDIEKVYEFLQKRNIIEFLNGIKDSGERAAEIVANMLEFSRGGSERLEPIDVNSIIEKSIDIASKDYDLKKKYDFKYIDIEKQFEDDLQKCMGNKQQFEQVIFNILKNSAHAMASSNTKEPLIKITTRKDDDNVLIMINDNGPGMDEETKNRVFDPFFTTKEVGEGTGLGLSVSYFIITDKHNGKIWLESNLGSGTTFFISLPFIKE